MDVVATIASAVVGAVFVVAGGSKIAAGQRWTAQARGLGAPAFTVPLVPWVEIVLGAAMVAQLARRPTAVLALLLLISFSALIALRLSEGKHPPCACFGAWSAKPLGAGHLVRNGVLCVGAALALL